MIVLYQSIERHFVFSFFLSFLSFLLAKKEYVFECFSPLLSFLFSREIVESKPARRNAKNSFCNNLIYLFFGRSSNSRRLLVHPPFSQSAPFDTSQPAQPSQAGEFR